jgi:hypothetical protein
MKKSLLLVALMLLPLMANASENDNLVNAKQKLASLYKYAFKYEDKLKGDEGTKDYVITTDPDSLANLNMETDLNKYFLFNVQDQNTLVSIPKELYNPDIEVEIGTTDVFYDKENYTYYKVGEGTKSIAFDNDAFSDITNKYGRVSNNDFFYLAPLAPTTAPQVEIKLLGNTPSTTNTFGLGEPAQVMSGKYDIMVVMVPYWYSLIPNENDTIADEFYDQHYIDSISAITKMCFTGQVRYNNDNANGRDFISKKSSIIEFDGSKVDTLMVFEDFEFPYSYKDLSYSYPTLILTGATKLSNIKKGFIYSLYIDRVILKSKESGEEIVIDPQTIVSFTEGQMATIILPTTPDPELGKYYRLDRREEGKIIFEEELAPQAHVPYIIMPKKDFIIDLSTLDLDGCYRDSVSVDGITFIGSYVSEDLDYLADCYIDIIDITPDCHEDDYCIEIPVIGALRAFLRVNTRWEDPYNPGGTRGAELQKKLEIVLHDNETAISEIKYDRVKTEKYDDAVYDLQGRQVANGQRLTAKGIYILNGKKIAVK